MSRAYPQEPSSFAAGRVLVTGGAGFVGTNVADRLLSQGHEVVVLDDMSRPGVRDNAQWLRATHRHRLEIVEGDVRDASAVRRALQGVDQVFHFAAQVAVTTSVSDPWHDFDVNLTGTMTLLEECRRSPRQPALLFTSTNKVYGALDAVDIVEIDGRHVPAEPLLREGGVSERQPLAFCSPYGCSKGAADQYVVDYAKSFGLRTLVFRMSCIYGRHQHGNEDQGWVAHFAKRALERCPITLYGDGKQVRDILFVDDLVDAMLMAAARSEEFAGRAFNIGGGPRNAVSLLAVLDRIGELLGQPPAVAFDDWRIGDQRWYVSDTTAFGDATGWAPRVDVDTGVQVLVEWLNEHAPAVAEAR